MSVKYILNHLGEAVIEPDPQKWASWFEEYLAARSLERTELAGDVFVSTVFLGINYNWGGGPPVLWETMVFGGSHDGEIRERYTSADEARIGHARIVETERIALAK